jgi:hypothetical protein
MWAVPLTRPDHLIDLQKTQQWSQRTIVSDIVSVFDWTASDPRLDMVLDL